jgi:hypothetical protein
VRRHRQAQRVEPERDPVELHGDLSTAFFGLVTPFSARLHPFDRLRTQAWNIAYLPYCTGDVHSGSKVRVRADRDGPHPRIQYHRSYANVKGAAQWRRNQWGQPGELLLTGFSAGGVGSTTTYAVCARLCSPGVRRRWQIQARCSRRQRRALP